MRYVAWLAVLAIVVPTGFAQAQEEQAPIDVDKEERVRVNLITIDTVVLDGQGRTVGGLTEDDFELSVQGRPQKIDTFDVLCPQAGLPEPVEIQQNEEREPFEAKSERRIVLAFDYYHLSHANRTAALRWGQMIASRDMAAGDGIMIVALADGLRIEQRFSGSPKQTIETLQRMEHDASLFGRTFSTITARSFLDNLSVLADVLAQHPGPKAVVLFSEWAARSDDWDSFFFQTAEHASAARTVFYPTWVPGLQAGGVVGGSPSLARLATESGGHFTRIVNDLSVGFVRARRDLTCRYALGFYSDPEASRTGRNVRVRVKEDDNRTRAPERIRLWSDEERQASRLRAAFSDPGPNEDPLVRALAFPFRPTSRGSWETLLAVNFPLHVSEQGEKRIVGVALDINTTTPKSGSELFEFPARKDGTAGVRPVSLYGVRKIKPGSHTLTVAISQPDGQEIKTTQLNFAIPEVPEGELLVQGPVLVRVDPDGIRLRVEGGKEVKDAELDELIGDAGFVPLVVSQVKSGDTLLAAWEICAVRTSAPDGATIERRIISDGEVVHRLDPIPIDLQGGKKLACQSGMDKLPGGVLDEGRYRFEVAVVDGDTDVARGLRPLSVVAD
jgi:VWFA-related protein